MAIYLADYLEGAGPLGAALDVKALFCPLGAAVARRSLSAGSEVRPSVARHALPTLPFFDVAA